MDNLNYDIQYFAITSEKWHAEANIYNMKVKGQVKFTDVSYIF